MESGKGRAAWVAAACGVFALATAQLYAPLFGEDLREVVPTTSGAAFDARATDWDRRFVIWLVARNAHAWLHHPWRLFDTGTCHPVPDTLSLGHPALSVGLLGVPGEIASGDPVVVFNVALILQTLLAAFAMYLLVADWTGERAAGIVAGLAYAFLPAKTGLILYPFHGDTGWTLLAFFSARRLIAGGGWRDALCFAAATSLQLAASFYTFLAAVCLGVPIAIWLAHVHGRAKLRPLPVSLAVLLVAAAALFVFGPFLAERDVLGVRPRQTFATLAIVSTQLFASVTVALLAALGLLLPSRLTAPLLRSPRWAFAAGATVAGLLATSSSAWATLSELLPGLDAVRVPLLLLTGVHLAWCTLAGLGAAGLLRGLAGSHRPWAAAALIAIVFLDTLRPPLPGIPTRRPYEVAAVRPPAEQLAFFSELAGMGNRGPILEAPIDYAVARHGFEAASQSVLLQAYHQRRTSACYNSFVPDAVRKLGPLAERLPEPAARRALTLQGFNTLVVRGSFHAADRAWQQRIARAADEGRGLVPILSRGGLSAYTLQGP